MAKRVIAVFGRADALKNETDYTEAREAGRILAREGFSIISGGYGGVMEAVSMGAHEKGGEAAGVVFAFEPSRSPNPYLTKAVAAPDLFERQKFLVERADGYIAFPPGAGTLSEVCLLWAHRKSGAKREAPLALVGEKWKRLTGLLREEGIIPENLLQYDFWFGSGVEAAGFMAEYFRENNSAAGKEHCERR
ncbi:MAG TPA: LOG family protein [Acidobacteriota bacterium]|nr:LOG family protein [Acidobacteriota bacterium]HNT17124.1 LOG family protein [Acidobacteriota bacterium]